MDYPERAECDFTPEYAYWEQVDVTPLREAKKLREQELTDDILRYTPEEVKDYVRDKIEELLTLK